MCEMRGRWVEVRGGVRGGGALAPSRSKWRGAVGAAGLPLPPRPPPRLGPLAQTSPVPTFSESEFFDRS